MHTPTHHSTPTTTTTRTTHTTRAPRSHEAHFGLALLLWLLLTSPAHAKRVALLMGNSNYQNESVLRNPLRDAELMASTLKGATLRFDQVVVLPNGTRPQMLQKLAEFKRQAQGADVALVYYSGHGMINSKRQNHVLPVDMPKISANAGLDVDVALKSYAVSEDEIIEAVQEAKVQVVVLDACRDNGFGASKSGTKGLSRRADESKNRLIAYATEQGHTAEDGAGSNSTYAASLAKHLVRTDWPLLTVFDAVTDDVERTTGGKQSPTRSGNLRVNVYLLASVAPVATGFPVQAQPDTEQEAWEIAKRRDTVASYGVYLNRYPSGRYAQTARDALEGLKTVPVPTSTPVPRPAQAVVQAASPTPQPSAQASMQPGQVFRDCADCPELVVIPAGRFTMGSSAAEQARANAAGVVKEMTDSENPQHRVTIQRFALGKYEVSRGEFERFVASSGYRTEAEQGKGCLVSKPDVILEMNTGANWKSPGFAQANDHPVVCVSWNDARAYVDWLNRLSPGRGFRLASEAEWEYAARAGSQTAYPWGDDEDGRQLCNHANHGDLSYSAVYTKDTTVNKNCTDGVVHTAGGQQFGANAFGLHHMHGNVWEWVQDCFEENYSQGQPTDGSAHRGNDSSCLARVLRGGSWSDDPGNLRSAIRGTALLYSDRYYDVGFRIARTVP